MKQHMGTVILLRTGLEAIPVTVRPNFFSFFSVLRLSVSFSLKVMNFNMFRNMLKDMLNKHSI